MKTSFELKMVKTDLSDVKTLVVKVEVGNLINMIESCYKSDSVSELILGDYFISSAKILYNTLNY